MLGLPGRRNFPKFVRLCLLLTLLFVTLTLNSFAQIAIIANSSVPLDTVNQGTLLDFYSGDISTWSTGEEIVLLDLGERGDVRSTFYEFLGKTSSRMKSIWLRRKLSGEGDPPESLDTEEEVLDRVKQTRGAIGFINVDLASDPSIKILRIIDAG